MSLLDVLRGVMLDPAEQAVYEADPGAYLQQHGYEGVDAADLSEAFGLVADTLPAEQAMAAYTGDTPGWAPLSPTMGADTTDFDEPPTVLDDVGTVGGQIVADAVDEVDDVNDDVDDVDDRAGDDAGDGSPLAGGFGDGHSTDGPDLGADTVDAPDLSFGLGEDLGADLDPAGATDLADDGDLDDGHVDLDHEDVGSMFGDALGLDDGPHIGVDGGHVVDVSGLDDLDDATDLDDGTILDDAADYGGPDDLDEDMDDNADDLDIGLF